MSTTSSTHIKEIKNLMKQVREALKQIEEAEKKQEQVRNVRNYEKAQSDVKSANISMMQALEEMVRLASTMGCTCNLYDIHKYHKVVELDFRDSHK